jgi:hypothetical protein
VEEYLNAVANYGFPIAMCAWFALRLEKILENNTAALNKVAACTEKIAIKVVT